jgi:hypothetical protein
LQKISQIAILTGMNKREFQALLDQSGSSLMRCARDLGLAQSTVSRWKKEVPHYAVWYAKARLIMTPEQRDLIDDRAKLR